MAEWKRHLQRAVEHFGSQPVLARAIGCSQSKISWLLQKAERLDAEDAVAIERATDGAVTRSQLRPDLWPADAACPPPLRTRAGGVMTGQQVVQIRFTVCDNVRELTERLLVFGLGEVVPCPVEFLDLISRFPSRSTAFNLNSLPAVGAGEHRVILELSGAGLELLAAMRAIQIPSDLAEKIRHRKTSSVESGDATVAESPPDRKAGGDKAAPEHARGAA